MSDSHGTMADPPDSPILRGYLRVMDAVKEQPVPPPTAFGLVGVSFGLSPVDTKQYATALAQTIMQAGLKDGPGGFTKAAEAAIYSALLTGLSAAQEFAGLTDLDRERWWEPRGEGEMTPYYLGRILDELDLDDMAKRARAGHFDDFHAPQEVDDGLGLIHLVEELTLNLWRCSDREDASQIQAVIDAVQDGEFDATKAESDRWAGSKAGQETFNRLAEDK